MNITAAAETAAVVKITRADGRVFTGTPVETETPGFYKIATGRRGRPAVIASASVESVEVVEA